MRIWDIGLAAMGGVALLASSPASAGVQYEYDSAGRLIKATYSNGVVIEYRYDSAGNRRSIITSLAPNQSPVAVNDAASVGASSFIDIMVRANDSDPDGDPLTVTSVGTPTGGGTVAIRNSGEHVRYTAPATAGTKTFTYTISDGRGGTASATVTVTVTQTNQPPVAVNDTAAALAGTTNAIMVRANDSDPDGHAITVTSVTQPSSGGGSVTIATGGTHVLYTAPLFQGVYTFTYTISDGHGGTATATATVNVSFGEFPDPRPCIPNPATGICERD